MSLPKTSLIIPCYVIDEKGWKMTEDCVCSLQDRPDEVILVNDGSLFWSSTLDHLVDRIILQDNKGFAGAVNAGLAIAAGDILMQANNDIMFTPGWLEGLLKPLEVGYDIASCRTTDSDGWTTEDKITEGDKFGSIWAMKRQVYDALGGFDERFGKGYFEDLDYRRRALDAGLRIAKNHAVVVEHRGHATFDVLDPDHKFFIKNKETFRRKHGFVE